MPLNTLRLNHAPSSHPNQRIVFIKPLPRPPSDQAAYNIADTLLRAIAAQCLPIMKSHFLSVTTLEEHEPNPEFIGRNFNNGEIIQLVLRGKNGGWLPVDMVQMVMMHELAHNVHMNHSKRFWETRNLFAGEMRELWRKGYTGEGLWGQGRTMQELEGVAAVGGVVPSEELKDLQVCGGTFRSRGRKRKRTRGGKDNEELTWKERKDRRIEMKFGKNGISLGEDEDKRLSFEVAGRGPMGVKPRVAQSKRGRELRAAAALARFDTNKKEIEDIEKLKAMEETDDDTQSEYEDNADAGLEDATDVNGQRMLDKDGRSMIKVCEEEDGDDYNVKQEMNELNGLDCTYDQSTKHPSTTSTANSTKSRFTNQPKSLYDIPQYQEPSYHQPPSSDKENQSVKLAKPQITIRKPQTAQHTPRNTPKPAQEHSLSNSSTALAPTPATKATTVTCPICSLSNLPTNPTCTACAHVLDKRKDPRSWSCTSEACKDSEYLNAGDMGVCGVCGTRKMT